MCLSKLTETNTKIKFGYKIFVYDPKDDELMQPLYNIKQDKRNPETNDIELLSRDRKTVPIDLWLKATNKKLAFYTPGNHKEHHYWSGFHFFQTKKSATEYASNNSFWLIDGFEIRCVLSVKKIQVSEIVASGYQSEYKCHVARYMKVLPI